MSCWVRLKTNYIADSINFRHRPQWRMGREEIETERVQTAFCPSASSTSKNAAKAKAVNTAVNTIARP